MITIEFFVPTTKNVSEPYDSSKETEQIARAFSSFFGGAFSQDVSGYYVADNGALVRETIHKVTSFADSAKLARHHKAILGIARNLARKLSQESILVQIGNEIHFISQN